MPSVTSALIRDLLGITRPEITVFQYREGAKAPAKAVRALASRGSKPAVWDRSEHIWRPA